MSREPEGWTRVLVGDIADINARSLPASTPKDYQFRYIDVATVAGPSELLEPRTVAYSEAPSRARRVVTSGDILVSTVRPYLRSFCQIKDDSADLVASTGFAVLTPKDTVSGEFLYQHVLSTWFVDHLAPRMKGSNYPAVSPQDVADYSFSLPPLPEQRRIAEILSSVDEAIQATQAVIEQTRKVKQGVLKHLLTKGIGHTRFQQTEIGEIPEGWSNDRFDMFITLQRGFDLPVQNRLPGDVPIYASNGIIGYHNEARISGPSVVTGRSGTLGKVFYDASSCWPLNTTLYVRDFHGNDPGFVYWFLQYFGIERFGTGTGVPTLNRNIVHDEQVGFPPLAEQRQIAKILFEIDASIETLSNEKNAVNRAKKALMSDLLTGRKRVFSDLPMAAE